MKINYDSQFLSDIKSGKFSKSFSQDEFPKLQQAAEVHGYRGASKKKHNGIVPIRPTDFGLLKTLNRLTTTVHHNLMGIPIKVVAHVPSGNRLVGYMHSNHTVEILGMANYDD